MSNALVQFGKYELSESDETLLRKTKCKEASDEQWQLYKSVCKHLRLSPILNQIHAVFRNDKKTGGKTMTIQVGIDGYRLMADRTGTVVAGRSPTFEHDKNGNLFSATSYMKKLTSDGTWHEISAIAYWSEYVQTYDGKPMGLWSTMPKGQLAKCAESLAIRRAAPYDEFALVRTDEEMEQADSEVIEVKAERPTTRTADFPIHQRTTKNLEIGSKPVVEDLPTMTMAQDCELMDLLGSDIDWKNRCFQHYSKSLGKEVKSFMDIPAKEYALLKSNLQALTSKKSEMEAK